MKKIMLGNEAIARGMYEAGGKVMAAYPGTPSTEVSEYASKYEEIYTEWSPNEKVALEVVAGASFAGVRSMACMKHVGVNVAADPLFTMAYTGVNAGAVILVADDPGMHSSQNEQDSRFYAMSSHIPMLEPSSSQEAKDFVKLAFEISEEYDTPVFLRETTRIAHSQSMVELNDRVEVGVKEYQKDISKYTMMPASAIKRHLVVEDREKRLAVDCNKMCINTVEYNSKKIGVICSGVVYQYVKDALPDASILKLGMVYPMPFKLIEKFAKQVERLIVIEELEPFFETQIKAKGIQCEGKNLFSIQGEVTVAKIKEKVLGIKTKSKQYDLPNRPPVMCAGCPHRGVFYILSKLKMRVCADIGCYTLGAQPPLSAVDTVLCMGASIGMAHGFEKALGKDSSKKTVAVIGDSTFIHSGITGLINAVYNKSNITVLILDNSTTGMTGHQDHPATGKTLKGEETNILNLIDVCKSAGVKSIQVVDAYELSEVERSIKEETEKEGVSVIIMQRPCALILSKYDTPFKVDNCKKCGVCLKLGCPAIQKIDGKAVINKEMCTGCTLCEKVCKFGCITRCE